MSSQSIQRRTLLKGIGAAAAASSLGMQASASSQTKREYDFVVIGAGPGGGPVAANLALAGFRVALVEAGINPLDSTQVTNPLTPFHYQIPLLFTAASESNEISWDFYVEHYKRKARQKRNSKYVDNKGILYPRGAALGGSAAHNAMVWMYPHDVDFDRIAEATGDDSWAAENMRPYFQRVEACGYCTPMDYGRGTEGYIPASWQEEGVFSADPVLQQLATKGARKPSSYYEGNTLSDVNHPLVARGDTGAFATPQHNQQQVRVTIAERLMAIAEQYPERLHLYTGTLATRLLIRKARKNRPAKAVGVRVEVGRNLYAADKDYQPRQHGEKLKLMAKHEVVLSGGTFNTPQLLMLSGIGDRRALKRQGIKTKVHLPGVGKNLQDRYEVAVSVELKEDLALLKPCRPGAAEDPCLDSYFSAVWDLLPEPFRGPYGMNGIVATRIEQSQHAQPGAPDLVLVGLPIGYTGIYPGYSQQWSARRWTWLVLKGHSTNNGGEISLRSANPHHTPHIRFNHFDEGAGQPEHDLDAMVEGIKLARSYLAHPDIAPLIQREVTPGTEHSTDAQLRQYVLDEAWGHHASCSAKIGSDEDPLAVLDSQFRVRGVDALRVVDASAFPGIPGFFPVAALFMISEKAADQLLADAYRRLQSAGAATG